MKLVGKPSALGDSYLSLNKFEEAAKAYETVVKIQRTRQATATGLCYDRLSRYEDSITALQKVVQLSPSVRLRSTTSGPPVIRPAGTKTRSMRYPALQSSRRRRDPKQSRRGAIAWENTVTQRFHFSRRSNCDRPLPMLNTISAMLF